MGCTQTVQHLDDSNTKIVRLDINAVRTSSTPKNEINLMKLTEDLIRVLQQICAPENALFERFQNEILNNQGKLEKRMDEVTYLISISKDQVKAFIERDAILNICSDLIEHLNQMLELNKVVFEERQEWYYRYAYVLIYEIIQFKPVLEIIKANAQLAEEYKKSREIMLLYSCILGIVRFLEGISWGYSVFLMHNSLDEDNSVAMKALFSLLLKLKQHFRETKETANSFQNDVQAAYYSDYFFKLALSYSSLEKLQGDVEKRDERKSLFLVNQVFRKTYIEQKKKLDEWLRAIRVMDITTAELVKQRLLKNVSKTTIRHLKNPANAFETNKQPVSAQEDPHGLRTHGKPMFELDNTHNIMLLHAHDHDAKLLLESFLQANVKARSKYKCVVLHHCTRENALSHDSYYIFQDIIQAIVRLVPSVKNYLRLQEHDFLKELLQPHQQNSLKLQTDGPQIFVKFCKVLREIKQDSNIGVFITGVENTWHPSKLDNFVYVLRSASVYFPAFLKIVVSLDPRSELDNQKCSAKVQKIAKILSTDSIMKITDNESFDLEAKSYMQFALDYKSPIMKTAQTNNTQPLEAVGEEGEVSLMELVDIALSRSKGSYRTCTEIIHQIHLNQINPSDRVTVKKFIEKDFQTIHEQCYNSIKKALEEDKKTAESVLNILAYNYGPMHLETFKKIVTFKQKDIRESAIKQTLLLLVPCIYLQNSQVIKENTSPSPQDYLENDRTVVVLRYKCFFKQAFRQFPELKRKDFIHNQILGLHLHDFEQSHLKEEQREETEFENLATYFRLYILDHLSKANLEKVFENLVCTFSAKNIYKQILYHRSYTRFRAKLFLLTQAKIERDERNTLIALSTILHLVEQTLAQEPNNFTDFCTQLRGRILGDQTVTFLSDLREDITRQDICYFKNFHHALRENPRIDTIFKFPMANVLKVKFFQQDKTRVILSLSNGLLLVYHMVKHQIEKIIESKFAILDCLRIIEDKYLVTAGIETKVRIWSIENEKMLQKFSLHPYSTSFLLNYKEYLISYGHDKKICFYNFKEKKNLDSRQMEHHVTAFKLTKVVQGQVKHLAVATINGRIMLFEISESDNLLKLKHDILIQNPIEEIIRIINLSNQEFLSFQKDGQMTVWSNSSLTMVREGSIFNLKSEDYIDMLLIKSKEYFLFTLERQKIEFYSVDKFKRTDSWDYFFEQDLITCDKNKEGSKIFVGDKGGTLTLFNFLKHLDQSKENQVPSNRRYDPVACVEVTTKLGVGKNLIVSCSQDRDLRIWAKNTGIFERKYDLSSFTGENITCMSLGRDENMLFLGSKDMNVYLIDICKGKLCVVYEGHWNRVTSIYTIPNKDILVTISESNIKVWDLEYDECIKNMNDHDSPIIHASQTPRDESKILTVGQNFEFKTWNYTTGLIDQKLNIEVKNEDPKKNLHIVCCHVLEDLAFIALNTNLINIYQITSHKVVHQFLSYNGEQIIHLQGLKTDENKYLIVVTRTSCILHQVLPAGVKRLCSYLINARKKPKKAKHDNKYSYNVRYYFTCANIQVVQEGRKEMKETGRRVLKANSEEEEEEEEGARNDEVQSEEVKQAMSEVLKEDESKEDESREGEEEEQPLMLTEQLREDANPLDIGSKRSVTDNSNKEEESKAHQEQQPETERRIEKNEEKDAKIMDTMQNVVDDTVVLVSLGDSRGYLHLNYLIIK